MCHRRETLPLSDGGRKPRHGAFIRQDDIRPKKEALYGLFLICATNAKPVQAISVADSVRWSPWRVPSCPILHYFCSTSQLGPLPQAVGAIFQKIVDINRTGVALLIVEQNACQALRRPTVATCWPWARIATKTPARRC